MSTEALTSDDFETIRRLQEGDLTPFNFDDETITDPVDRPPKLTGVKITREKVGQMIVDYAQDHTNQETADHFGISKAVVDWHLYHDPAYADVATIDTELCKMMRWLAADGCSYTEIKRFARCSRSAVMNHVSSTGGTGCQHNDVIDVPRADMKDSAKAVDGELCKELRRRVASGESCYSLADEFDIGHRTVNRHVSANIRNSWKCKHNSVPRVDLKTTTGLIDEQRCNHMRLLAWYGYKRQELADMFEVSGWAISKHVSSSIKQERRCDHSGQPRIEL